jgi:hypothetical protein
LSVAPVWKFAPPTENAVPPPAGPDVGAIDDAVGPGIARHAANSDVLPPGSVAVAVSHGPVAAEENAATNATLPPPSVWRSADPRKRCPGP